VDASTAALETDGDGGDHATDDAVSSIVDCAHSFDPRFLFEATSTVRSRSQKYSETIVPEKQ
jgi:hypothetical protein